MQADSKLQAYFSAKAKRRNWEDLFEECYEYALPQRESFYTETAGQRRDDKIFDETAVVGTQEFASRLQAGLIPNFSRWADLVGGSEIPAGERDEINAQLDEVTDYVFEVIQNSNFAQEAHESFLDLAVGTGVLFADEGDSVSPVVFSAVPLPHVVLDSAPDGTIGSVYRERKQVKREHVPTLFPKADMSKLPAGGEKFTLVEGISREYDRLNVRSYTRTIMCVENKAILHEEVYEGIGSNPAIPFRWSTCAGEVYGRGPLINALSAIKTTNLTVELILENAQMAISGVYQMEDDGVINVDTINLVPGSIIPKAMGSAGLQPINAAGRFDVSQLILGDMRLNIKRALFNDMLGDPNKTPATATEVAERMADLSRRMGAAFGRLQTEFVQPVLQRVVYILRKRGLIELPTINGREVRIRADSPLSQAQANQDISSIGRFLQLVGGTFGPDILNILIDQQEVSIHLAKKFGVPESLIRNEQERAQLVQALQQAQQGQAIQEEQLGG